ncbi:hypothetical protein BC829DRAFT_280808 [Chytridium lagenaria]|nr:hypothetical protein BC829DRAFT_280808 [Chytridium lagenaria]
MASLFVTLIALRFKIPFSSSFRKHASSFFTITESYVFLQLQPPLFGENRITDLTHLNGIVLTNVTINPSGEPKDFFDIPSRLWEIIKMSNTQISYRSDFCSVILEFVDDIDGHETSKTLSPAQKSRLFKVSQFYRAIASYVTSTGLTNADYNLPLDRPAGILDVMSWPTYQECRRRWLDHLKKRSICAGPATNSSLSMISNILKVDTPSVISYDLEVGAIETLDVNNYSIEVQSLMECATTAAQHFLHSHPAADDLFKIRALQTDLMTRGLLRPFTSIELGNIMKDFDSVMDENCINLGTLKVDLLQFMTSGNVRVWSSLHSGLALSSKVSTNHLALRFWSVWDVIRDGDRHAFHIFVSLNHPRPAEAVLHSFLASKGYSYEQATEAEMG